MSSLQGLGEKANDSLDMMFDTTANGEYKSYNSSRIGQSQPCDDDDDIDDEEEEEQDSGRFHTKTSCVSRFEVISWS